MIIKRLKLRNFRNIDFCDIEFNQGINVFLGNNGQGKTNYLESIYFLSTTRSFRISNDQAMIQFEKPFSNIECVIKDSDNDIHLSTVLHNKGKTLFIGNKQISKASDFVGKLNAIVFSPEDLELFNSSPKERRKLMNIEIGKVSAKYNNSLSKYLKQLKERNVLLKTSKDTNLLDVFDKQLIEESINVIKSRKYFVEYLNQNISEKYQKLTNTNRKISCYYKTLIDLKSDDYEMELSTKYQKTREKDLFTSITNIGIHRDDIEFEMDNVPLNEIASQGQKRLVLLALKLCLIDFVKHSKNITPVLLLDDVLSELDKDNQRRLFSLLKNKVQTVITTTDLNDILQDDSIKFVYIENGMVKENKDE